MMYNNWGWGWHGLGFGFGGILMIAFWALIIWAIIALVRRGGHGGCCGIGEHKPGEHKGVGLQKKTALEILDERYAKGEIDKEEYAQKKKDLKN